MRLLQMIIFGMMLLCSFNVSATGCGGANRTSLLADIISREDSSIRGTTTFTPSE